LKYVYFEILIIGAIIPSFVWKFTKGKLSLFNYLDGHFMKSKIPVVVILFLWSTFVLSGQVQIKFDTIYCIGNTLQQVRDNITNVKFDNYDDISYKFQFKINRIKVPENADIIFFDENSHYDRNIESCNGAPFAGGTIEKMLHVLLYLVCIIFGMTNLLIFPGFFPEICTDFPVVTAY
jgi:hypothetical protein